MFNSQCSILIRKEKRPHVCEPAYKTNDPCCPTSTSDENWALGIEHWSDPRSDSGQRILLDEFHRCVETSGGPWSPKNIECALFGARVVEWRRGPIAFELRSDGIHSHTCPDPILRAISLIPAFLDPKNELCNPKLPTFRFRPYLHLFYSQISQFWAGAKQWRIPSSF